MLIILLTVLFNQEVNCVGNRTVQTFLDQLVFITV